VRIAIAQRHQKLRDINQATSSVACELRQESNSKAPTSAALQHLASIEVFSVRHLDTSNLADNYRSHLPQ